MMPMGDIPRHHAQRKAPETPALIYPGASATWSALESRATRLAKLYGSRGVINGDFVGIALRNSIDYHATAFALWKLGAIPAPLSPRLAKQEFVALVNLLKPRLIVSDSAETFEYPMLRPSADLSNLDDTYLPSETGPYWKAACTGGSTGQPKVIVLHAPPAFDPESPDPMAQNKLRPDGVLLNPGPLYHNAPFLYSSLALFTGSTVIGMERFDAEETLRLIEAHRVNWVCLVPTMMHRIWSLPGPVRERYDLSSLDAVWHMASACPIWLKQVWIDWLGADRIWERYGGTEGFGSTTIGGREWLDRRGSVGRLINGAQVKVRREDGTECANGEVGELFFYPAGGHKPSHYIGAEPRCDAQGGLSLGDLGHLDDQGYVYLADRRTDIVVRGGANIYPAEVEAVLDQHPQVASSIVIGLPCEEMGARVHAILQPQSDVIINMQSVRAFLEERLEKYKWPESYELFSGSLRDDTGKARRLALRAERVAWMERDVPFRMRLTDSSGS